MALTWKPHGCGTASTGRSYDANYRDESPAFAFIEGFQLAERLLRGAAE